MSISREHTRVFDPEKRKTKMNKYIFVLALVIGVFVCVNVFARDDDHLQDITNWTPFFTEGKTLSYEHEDGSPLSPKTYNFEDAIEYEYFYTKVELPQDKREELQNKLREDNVKKFENVKLGYMIFWYRLDCKNEMIELIQSYAYSDKNNFIVSYDMAGKQKAEPFKGSRFERIPFNKDWIKEAKEEAEHRDKNEALKIKLKKYGAEALVPINQLEVNPYEFEGHTVAVVVQFKKMLSKNSASFYSGYTDLGNYTNVSDEIIVAGIPEGAHFESGLYAPRLMMALKGKGTIAGTNAFGAKIKAPYFQWIDIISGEQPSVFDEQRDTSRKNALQNVRNARPSRTQ